MIATNPLWQFFWMSLSSQYPTLPPLNNVQQQWTLTPQYYLYFKKFASQSENNLIVWSFVISGMLTTKGEASLKWKFQLLGTAFNLSCQGGGYFIEGVACCNNVNFLYHNGSFTLKHLLPNNWVVFTFWSNFLKYH